MAHGGWPEIPKQPHTRAPLIGCDRRFALAWWRLEKRLLFVSLQLPPRKRWRWWAMGGAKRLAEEKRDASVY